MIKVKNLCKSFRITSKEHGLKAAIKSLFKSDYTIKEVVKNISFNISEGEIIGYIGPNGAGKSTTIKMLTGILVPSAGEVSVCGILPWNQRIDNGFNIGVVFGQRSQLWWDIPVYDTFNLLSKLYKLSKENYKRNLSLIIDVFELKDLLHIPVRQLSLGQRMRAEIASAIIHNPKVLYLDEPTIGLDIVIKRKIREFIKRINKDFNTTIILTTHDVSEIEKVCNRVIVIDKGELIYDDSLKQLKDRFSRINEIEIKLDNAPQGIMDLQSENINIRVKEHTLKVKYSKEIKPIDIINKVAINNKILDFNINENDLEEIIHSIYVARNN
ncbi:MAG: ATP-binding cassette domain-containing protein [Spirochaetales bacterium]|nr:ATP-binding cassette domain-containing protein [Spirochaetales bacterium]